MPKYKFNPITGKLDLVVSDADLDPTYLRLDTTNDPLTAGLIIDGSADEDQLTIQAVESQTANLIVGEKSDGTDVFVVDELGNTTIGEGGATDSIMRFYDNASLAYHVGFDESESRFVISGNAFDATVDLMRFISSKVTVMQDFGFTEGMTVANRTITTTSVTLDDTDYVVLVDDDTAGSAVTVNLPAAALHTDRIYHIKRLGSTALVTVDGNASETIDGELTFDLYEKESITIISDGVNWHIL